MTEPELVETGETEAEGAARRATLTGLAVLFFLAAAAILGAIQFARAEYERERLAWGTRLDLVAASRLAAVNGWLDAQAAVPRKLAANTSLKLYVTEATLGSDPAAARASVDYLNALMAATAEQNGFWVVPDQTVKANVAPAPDRGIAYVDAGGKVIAATPGMPDIRADLGRAGLGNLLEWRTPSGKLGLMAVAPVRGIQADDSSLPLGWVVAVKPLDNSLFDALDQPGDASQTGFTALLHNGVAGPEVLTAPGEKAALSGQAVANIFSAPDGFGEARGDNGKLLITVRKVDAPEGWRLVRGINRNEALGEVAFRWWLVGGGLVAAILAVAAVILLAWRHGASVRLARMAEAERAAAIRFAGLSAFLRTVTDRQPTLILALDRSQHLTFANARAVEWSGDELDADGKSLAQLFGHAGAEALAKGIHDGLEGRAASHTALLPCADGEKNVQVHTVPLPDGVSPFEGARSSALLLVAEDLTDLMEEKAKRERTLKGLISTLMAMMDARDPFAAGQSARVAEVGGAIARAMLLDPLSVETVETAGMLINLGKFMVSRDVLTRTTPLSPDELQQVRDSLEKGADIVEHLAFEGPVAATIRQCHLRFDGRQQDPALHGESILLTARVLAVANAFVAMTSPRAHRPGKPIEAVETELQGLAGTMFDRAVVAALAHVLENEGGRTRWAHFAHADRAPSAA